MIIFVRPSSSCLRRTLEPPQSCTAPHNTPSPGSPAGSPPGGTCWPVWTSGARYEPVEPDETLKTTASLHLLFSTVGKYSAFPLSHDFINHKS